MSRELNRELFGEPAQKPVAPRSAPPRPSTEMAAATTEDLNVVGFQIQSVVRKLKEFESKLELITSKSDELSAMSKLRFERIQGHFQRQAEGFQATVRDIHSKIATVASRINERKMSDATIADMVERHQQLVQTFEVRLQQLQKVMSEQELQLVSSRAELRAAMKELERLKRG